MRAIKLTTIIETKIVPYESADNPPPEITFGEVLIKVEQIGAVEALGPNSIQYQGGARACVGLHDMGKPWLYYTKQSVEEVLGLLGLESLRPRLYG